MIIMVHMKSEKFEGECVCENEIKSTTLLPLRLLAHSVIHRRRRRFFLRRRHEHERELENPHKTSCSVIRSF